MSVVLGPKNAAAGVPGDRDAVWEAYIWQDPPSSAAADGAQTVRERRGSPILLASDDKFLESVIAATAAAAAAAADAASGSRGLTAQNLLTQVSHARLGGV